jgi:cytochrome c oxidase cbb3-type subunit 3
MTRFAVLSGLMFLLAHVAVRADTGGLLFRTHCSPCHGVHGEGGKGPALNSTLLPRAPDDAALSAVITGGIPGTGMPGTRMTSLENHELVAYVRALASNQPEQARGDASRGEMIFRGKGACLQCHRVGNEGGISGPDLSAVGLRRGASHIYRSITEAGAEVPDNFNVYRKVISVPDNYLFVLVETTTGQKYSGVRINEDTFSIQLRDTRDRLMSFRKSDLAKLVKRWGYSPMPSYTGMLSEEEIGDVVAYLSALRGPR